MSRIQWDKEEEKIVILGCRKANKITATMGELKIIARAKMTRNERIKYTRATVDKLDISAMSGSEGVKLKEGYGMEDMVASQLELNLLIEEMLIEKAFVGKSEISVDETFIRENSDFQELRDELLLALKEVNGLVGKLQETEQEEPMNGTEE